LPQEPYHCCGAGALGTQSAPDAHPRADAHTHGEPDANLRYADRHPHQHADTHEHIYDHAHADTLTYTHRDVNLDAQPDTEQQPNTDRHADTDQYADDARGRRNAWE
jgi:hypothetical protein